MIVSMTDPNHALALKFLVEALVTDGAHHKQWLVERALEALGIDLSNLKINVKGRDYDWEEGIAP